MANIALIDTGFVTIKRTGSTDKINSGNAVELKGTQIRYDLGSNVDDSPVPGLFQSVKINVGSIENAKIVIAGFVDRTNSTDMTNLKYIRDMVKTKGVKLFYYTSSSDGFRDITDSLGDLDISGTNQVYHNDATVGELGEDIPHIHVRVMGFNVRQNPGTKLLTYRITLTETA